MLSRIPDRNIWLIFTVTLILGVAYGVSLAVLGIHLEAHGVTKVEMGTLGAVFALGVAALAVPAGASVRRFGPKATLVCAVLGYAACVAAFPFLQRMWALAPARFLDGACSAGVWVSAETALLSRARRQDRAFVMSIYASSLALGYLLGALAAIPVLGHLGTDAAFLAAGGLAVAAALLVLLRLDGTPVHAEGHAEGAAAASGEGEGNGAATPAGRVFWRVKIACLATFSYGYFQASVVGFLPLYLIHQKHVAAESTPLTMGVFSLGMLLFCTYFGGLGDRTGHLRVMRALGAVGTVMVASFVVLDSFALMCVAIFVAGASLASISPVSLALLGHASAPGDLTRANAFYNASYAAGMLVGPFASGLLFERLGGGAMLVHLAVLWAGFVVTTVVFAADDPRAAARQPA